LANQTFSLPILGEGQGEEDVEEGTSMSTMNKEKKEEEKDFPQF